MIFSIENPKFSHSCMYCAYLYNNERVRKIISENYLKINKEIDNEFSEKIQWFKSKSKNGFLQVN